MIFVEILFASRRMCLRSFFYILFVSCIFINTFLFASDEKIVGGRRAVEKNWPWMAALMQKGVVNGADAQFCGGTLIHPQWVVTAAHCLEEAKALDIEVVLGGKLLKNIDVLDRVSVKNIIIHRDYNSQTTQNDIALIYLDHPVNNISPLPYITKENEFLSSAGIVAKVLGYGLQHESDEMIDGILYEVNLPIVSNIACSEVYEDEIFETNICAGYKEGKKDSCSGDSGGPLIVPDFTGKYHLAGIVSWGEGCARKNKFGVYTRVTKFIKWIEKNIKMVGPQGLEPWTTRL